jgi:hypothetical protein
MKSSTLKNAKNWGMAVLGAMIWNAAPNRKETAAGAPNIALPTLFFGDYLLVSVEML